MYPINPELQKQKMLRNSIAAIESNNVYDKAFAVIDGIKEPEKKETVLHLIYIIQSQDRIINYLDSVCPAEEKEPPVFYPMSTPARRR